MMFLRAAMAIVLAFALAACDEAPDVPTLRLSPASLGRTLALQQRLTVTVRGQSQQMEVALEADADAVRMAMLVMGQAAARLEWDGKELREARAPGWPEFVRGDRILGDLQLVYWPADAVRAALPAGWTLEADASHRVLAQGGRTVIEVRYLPGDVAELTNHAGEYRLRVESRALAS
jgi:hypothetical protein